MVIHLVRPERPHGEEIVQLSTHDQLMPRRYMSLLHCFRTAETIKKHVILSQLKKSLSATLNDFSQFAGELQRIDGQESALQLLIGPESSVLFRESHDWAGPSYDELFLAKFPRSMLPDGQLIVPAELTRTENDGIRVVVVQATFIPGGLLLTASIHHTLVDVRGMELFISTWAKATATLAQGQSITAAPLCDGSYDRWRLSYGPINHKAEEFLEFRDQAPLSFDIVTPKDDTSIVASDWHISPDALQNLKTYVEPTNQSNNQVSNSNALFALVARHVYKSRFGNAKTEPMADQVVLYTASDFRQRLEPPLPSTFLGNASVGLPIPIALSQLCDPNEGGNALYQIASTMQDAVQKYDTASFRSRLGFYNQHSLGAVIPKLSYYPGPNMLVTDWSAMDFYSFNWGSNLGYIDAFRSIGAGIGVGTCNINPKMRDGGLEVLMKHERGVIERMSHDSEFAKFVQLVGC